MQEIHKGRLFAASCVAIVTTSMVFSIRGDIIDALAADFRLTKEQVGLILSPAFWGFTLSILIGGSLVDRGGHNPIEAVRQGSVVLTGPHWQNFADTYEALIKQQAATVVGSATELAEAAARLIGDEAALAEMRERAEQALAKLSGALERTVEALLRHLPAEDQLAPAS